MSTTIEATFANRGRGPHGRLASVVRRRRPIALADPAFGMEAKAFLSAAEVGAERAYAWVRTAVLGILWVLVLLTDDGHHHGVAARVGLGIYTTLTAATWVAHLRGWRHPVLTFGTALVDVVLVAGHLALVQRMQPDAGSGGALLPVATLGFLLVAQATLRFRAGLVLCTGLAAATATVLVEPGLAMLDHAPTGLGPGDAAMSASHWEVLGPITLLLVTGILGFQAWRTKLLVDQTVDLATRVGRLSRFFSPTVASTLARGNGLGSRGGERKMIAILFVDLRGFTALAETANPEELGAFLTEFRQIATRCVFDCGGTIDKFLGDGVLAVFGAHRGGQREPAACALLCGRAILIAIDGWSMERRASGLAPVDVTIGAHFGEAFVGIIGSGPMLEFTAIGDSVNVAQRLQALAAAEGYRLVASDDLRRAARDGEDVDSGWRALRQCRLEGRADPIDLWVRQAFCHENTYASPYPLPSQPAD